MYDILLLMVPGHYAADFLIKMICSMQEGCMTPGDKLLPVNGESALGYTVEKVHCVSGNKLQSYFIFFKSKDSSTFS